MNKTQTIAAQVWLLGVHGYLIKECVERGTQSRHRGHGRREILPLQQRLDRLGRRVQGVSQLLLLVRCSRLRSGSPS